MTVDARPPYVRYLPTYRSVGWLEVRHGSKSRNPPSLALARGGGPAASASKLACLISNVTSLNNRQTQS